MGVGMDIYLQATVLIIKAQRTASTVRRNIEIHFVWRGLVRRSKMVS